MNDPDFDRLERLGFPEIVYGESKSAEQLAVVASLFAERRQSLLITRLQKDKVAVLPGDGAWDPVGRTWVRIEDTALPRSGRVGVISAGTSDAPVVAETVTTLAFLGFSPDRFEDAGVAGVHRLLAHHDRLEACDVLICIAGFEGALVSVVAGLFGQPIIGVPTSVGYGVAAGGFAALNAMLSSCANGVLVTNIDNGCGAALAACRILGRAIQR